MSAEPTLTQPTPAPPPTVLCCLASPANLSLKEMVLAWSVGCLTALGDMRSALSPLDCLPKSPLGGGCLLERGAARGDRRRGEISSLGVALGDRSSALSNSIMRMRSCLHFCSSTSRLLTSSLSRVRDATRDRRAETSSGDMEGGDAA